MQQAEGGRAQKLYIGMYVYNIPTICMFSLSVCLNGKISVVLRARDSKFDIKLKVNSLQIKFI